MPSQVELQAYRDATVPDLLPPRLRLLFVGINPSLWTAAVGAHFARPGNRFHPALAAAGILPRIVDASTGYRPEDLALFHERGIGITNVVRRATARADELTRQELRDGAARLTADIARWRPAVVAVLGITAYRQGFDRIRAMAGLQSEPLAGAQLWVVPNPSGLNAHQTTAGLAAAYAEPAAAAGLFA